MATTTRWALRYPAGTDAADVPLWMSRLASDLDAVAMDDQGLLADRPVSTGGSPGKRGRYYYATDAGPTGTLYRDNGAGWNALGTEAGADAAAWMFQDGIVAGGVTTRQSASVLRVAAGSAWITGADGVRRYCTWLQTDISVNWALANARVTQAVIPAPSYHGEVVVPIRLDGSDQVGATLDNAAGTTSRAALGTRLRVAEAVVTTGGISPTATDLRDRRPWAKGAENVVRRTSGDLTVTPSTGNALSSEFTFRLETSGGPVRVRLKGEGFGNADLIVQSGFTIDGAHSIVREPNYKASVGLSRDVSWETVVTTLTAGSHLFAPRMVTTANTFTLGGIASQRIEFEVQELLQPVNSNGSA